MQSLAALPGRQGGTNLELHESVSGSPRRSHLRDAGWRTMALSKGSRQSPRTSSPPLTAFPAAGSDLDFTSPDAPEPLNTLVQAFSSYGAVDRETFRPLIAYLERLSVPQGRVLWAQGAAPDGLYIVEAGVLRASYRFAEHVPPIEESMVPGTLAGELSALSGLARNATVVVERAAVLWKLSAENLRRLDAEQPELARTFTKLVLKCALRLFFFFCFFCFFCVGARAVVLMLFCAAAAKVDYDILLSALATRQ